MYKCSYYETRDFFIDMLKTTSIVEDVKYQIKIHEKKDPIYDCTFQVLSIFKSKLNIIVESWIFEEPEYFDPSSGTFKELRESIRRDTDKLRSKIQKDKYFIV